MSNSINHSIDSLPLFLRVDDICTLLQIGRSTAYELVRCGRIPSIRVGTQIRIPKDAIKSLSESTQA